MAIVVQTGDPNGVIQKIHAAIQNGLVRTWAYDDDGDFTHTADQWRNRAWLRPRVKPGQLILIILAPNNAQLTKDVYGVFHGRFIEMLLTHLDAEIESARATSMPAFGDRV